MDHLKMYFLLKLGMFHCYVSLPEGNVQIGGQGFLVATILLVQPGFDD